MILPVGDYWQELVLVTREMRAPTLAEKARRNSTRLPTWHRPRAHNTTPTASRSLSITVICAVGAHRALTELELQGLLGRYSGRVRVINQRLSGGDDEGALVLAARYPDQTLILVSHTVVNRAILLGVLGLGNDRFWRLRQGRV